MVINDLSNIQILKYMKKLYSNTLMQFILALYIFSFTACQEFDIDSQPEGPLNIQIDALDAYTVLATSPSNIVFNISSNTPWTITSNKQWCTPSPAMSAASSLVSEIVVTMENNPEKQSRTATLTIKGEGLENDKVITITQASKEELQIIPYDELVPTIGGTISFDIISNKPWKVIPSSQFISNIDKTSGEGNADGAKETITITIPANSGAMRHADVTIKTDFEEKSFTITQNGLFIEPENAEELTNELDGGITEKTIKINSNVEWEVKVPEEFKTWLNAETDGDNLRLMTTTYNNLFIPRTGHVLLCPKQNIPGFEDVSIKVIQALQFNLGNIDDALTLDEATGYVKVIKNCNITSKYVTQKGHLTFEFDEMNLTGTSNLLFNMYPTVSNSNYYLQLQSNTECIFQCGGPDGFKYGQAKFALSTAEINAIRKVEFYIEDDPAHTGNLRLRVLIDGHEKAIIDNRNNGYELAPEKNPGQVINLTFKPAVASDYYVIKSVAYEPEK